MFYCIYLGDNGDSREHDDSHGLLPKHFDSRTVTKEDIAIVEAVLDQQRIYDIYFTSMSFWTKFMVEEPQFF